MKYAKFNRNGTLEIINEKRSGFKKLVVERKPKERNGFFITYCYVTKNDEIHKVWKENEVEFFIDN